MTVRSNWQIREYPSMATIFGTKGNDTLAATAPLDLVYGLAGNDKLTTTFSDVLLSGGAGNDQLDANVDATVTGSAISISLAGGAGRDRLDSNVTGSDIRTSLSGDDGSDQLLSKTAVQGASVSLQDDLSGGDGNDDLSAISDLTTTGGGGLSFLFWDLNGEAGADHLKATATVNNTSTNPDDGVFEGWNLGGGDGNDVLDLSVFNLSASLASEAYFSVAASGGNGSDQISFSGEGGFTGTSVYVKGEQGKDVITIDLELNATSRGTDIFAEGGGGGDCIVAHLTSDAAIDFSSFYSYFVLDGNDGDDHILGSFKALDGGGSISMTLQGGAGNDRLIAEGGNGNDFRGGAGSDTMTGSTHVDYFTFGFLFGDPYAELADGHRDRDVITNYSKGEGDQIQLPNGIADVVSWDVTGSSTRLTFVGDHDVLVLQGLVVTNLADDVIFA
jgi:Ca2+-binding RTX toxin-like protein